MDIHFSQSFKIAMSVIALIALTPPAVLFVRDFVDKQSTTDEEIKDRFCRKGVSTLEGRPSDEYCVNPELYRQHMEKSSDCLSSSCKAL